MGRVVLVLAAFWLAQAVPSAHARATLSLPGPAAFPKGIVSLPLFEDTGGTVRAAWLKRARALGSTAVRIQAFWNQIAPSSLPRKWRPTNPADPHYDWSHLDDEVRSVAASGQQTLVVVRAAPAWAEGPDPPPGLQFGGIWFPNARDFGQFGHALAARYSGHFPDPVFPGRMLPRVSWWQAWNEANLTRYLMPQWGQVGNRWVAFSPGIYRSLLNAFYAGVKSAVPSDLVLAAGTAPYGDSPGTGQGRMWPVTFWEGVFCLNSRLRPLHCPNPAHFDVLDHHPYALTPTVHARNPLDVGVADIYKLQNILRAAERWHTVLPAGHKPFWITEIDWSTAPPISEALQQQFLSLGFYVLWRQGVSRVFWFQLQDYPPAGNSFALGGLFRPDGSAKPAATAYGFPFVALRAGRRTTLVWGDAPYAGTVAVQKLAASAWRTVAYLRTTSGGVLYATLRLGAHGTLRAVLGGVVSAPYSY